MLILIIASIILFIVFIKVHSRYRKPARAAIANMLLGVVSLMLVAPIASVSVNILTVFAALVLGIPGTLLVTLGTALL